MTDKPDNTDRKKNHVPREGSHPGSPRLTGEDELRHFTRQLFGDEPWT